MNTILENAYAFAALNAAKTGISAIGNFVDIIKQRLIAGIPGTRKILDEYATSIFSEVGDSGITDDDMSWAVQKALVAKAVVANNAAMSGLVANVCGMELEDCLPIIRLYAGTEIVAENPYIPWVPRVPYNSMSIHDGTMPLRKFRTFGLKPTRVISFTSR